MGILNPALEARARAIRAKALSGYSWNVAKTWEEAPNQARMIWLGKAQAEINADGASTPQNDPAKFALARQQKPPI